jgi:hypothetical protein
VPCCGMGPWCAGSVGLLLSVAWDPGGSSYSVASRSTGWASPRLVFFDPRFRSSTEPSLPSDRRLFRSMYLAAKPPSKNAFPTRKNPIIRGSIEDQHTPKGQYKDYPAIRALSHQPRAF